MIFYKIAMKIDNNILYFGHTTHLWIKMSCLHRLRQLQPIAAIWLVQSKNIHKTRHWFQSWWNLRCLLNKNWHLCYFFIKFAFQKNAPPNLLIGTEVKNKQIDWEKPPEWLLLSKKSHDFQLSNRFCFQDHKTSDLSIVLFYFHFFSFFFNSSLFASRPKNFSEMHCL